MAYIKIDEANRITAASIDFHCGDGEIEVELPSEVTLENIHDYIYENGEFKYSPLPEPEPPEPPEPSGGDYVTYDELAKAIREGVNSYGI